MLHLHLPVILRNCRNSGAIRPKKYMECRMASGAVPVGMNTLPHIEVIPDPSSASNYNTAQKNSYLHGNRYVSVKIANTTKRNNVIQKFKEHTPIYDSSAFSGAPDGVYIYLLSDKGFSAIQARSYLELGTKHKILAKETGASKVFIAGELSKKDKTVTFNLLSGTYTLHLVDENATGTLQDKMQTEMQSTLEAMGLTATFTTKTFIDKKKLPLSDPELALYKNMGYEIRSFPKEGFCSEEKIATLRAELTMKQNTLTQLREKLEAEIAEIQAKLAGAEECARKSTTLGGAFTNGKRKNLRATKKARKYRYRYSRRN